MLRQILLICIFTIAPIAAHAQGQIQHQDGSDTPSPVVNCTALRSEINALLLELRYYSRQERDARSRAEALRQHIAELQQTLETLVEHGGHVFQQIIQAEISRLEAEADRYEAEANRLKEKVDELAGDAIAKIRELEESEECEADGDEILYLIEQVAKAATPLL